MKKILLFFLSASIHLSVFSQAPPKPYGPIPTKAQLTWQETDMYCLIHFGPDTFTDKEWGYGDEDPAIFNPTDFNAMQIVGAAKAGGFKGIIVVAKHHDGFCLWPTKTTEHNISKSPYKNGKGDILKEYREACNKLGMKMGVYCSPWDRNSALYGKPEYVTDVYRKQLTELYTNYGPLFIIWHDGANGGAKEIRKIDRSIYYGWNETWALARKLQPGAVIFGDVGPDVRWIGNERGEAGTTSWETYTPHAPEPGKAPGNGFVLDKEGIEGHRDGKYWMPAECDVPLRPGWFYHTKDDGKTKTPTQLMDIYLKSVGRGACLDLGLAPNKSGLISAEDVASLKGFGQKLRNTFVVNLLRVATVSANNVRGNNKAKFGPGFVCDDNRYSYWATDDGVTSATLLVDFHERRSFDIIQLRENVKLGQRIDSVAIDVMENNRWRKIAGATSIGANKIIKLDKAVFGRKFRLRVLGSKGCIALSDFGFYDDDPVVIKNFKID